MELYKTQMRPFKTIRPREIIATPILKELGAYKSINEHQIPFEMPITKRCIIVRSGLRHPPTVKTESAPSNAQVEAPARVQGSQDPAERETSISKAEKATEPPVPTAKIQTVDETISETELDSLPPTKTESRPLASPGVEIPDAAPAEARPVSSDMTESPSNNQTSMDSLQDPPNQHDARDVTSQIMEDTDQD